MSIYEYIEEEYIMNVVPLVVAGVAAYVLGMSGTVILVATDEDSRIGPVLTFMGWLLMVLASVIVIGILAELGNSGA